MIDATLTGKPYPIKAWVVYGQNVLESIPQRQKTLKAIEQLEFMVVVDVLPMKQMNYADLVLPEATYLERYDMPAIVSSAKQPFYRDSPARGRAAVRNEAGLVDRQADGGSLGLEAYFPWDNPEQHLED